MLSTNKYSTLGSHNKVNGQDHIAIYAAICEFIDNCRSALLQYTMECQKREVHFCFMYLESEIFKVKKEMQPCPLQAHHVMDQIIEANERE